MVKSLLKDSHPDLFKTIDVNRTDPELIKRVTTSNPKKIWWLCDKGHSFEASPSARTRERVFPNGKKSTGQGCPICSNRQLLEGFNDLATTHPNLLQEWNWVKNNSLNIFPNKIFAGKANKVWWVCDKGHEWEAVPNSRSNPKNPVGCPICAGHQVISGVNDLYSQNPAVALEWNLTKNNNLTPNNVHVKSSKKVWWVCDKGHEWEAAVYSRAKPKSRPKGNACPVCHNYKIVVGVNDLSTTYPELADSIDLKLNPDVNLENLHSGSKDCIMWVCGRNPKHVWKARVSKRAQGEQGCPKCSNRVSRPETTIADFIENIITRTGSGMEVLRNDRKVLDSGKELDIYIPDKRIAVEFNGLYYHTESAGKGRRSHYEKWFECYEKGIQLIQIWEDDWNRNPELIKNMLSHKLGLNVGGKVFARKTKVVTLTVSEAKTFFNEYHIQGYSSGSLYIGLESDNIIVAAMVLKKDGTRRNWLNIVRYATSTTVVGGFTKILSYVEKHYQFDGFVTFSDHAISDGELYGRNGFTAEAEIAPDYMYVVKGRRVHKFGYRLKRFKDDPKLKWQEGLSETQLAKLNGLERIWDAGKTRWEKLHII